MYTAPDGTQILSAAGAQYGLCLHCQGANGVHWMLPIALTKAEVFDLGAHVHGVATDTTWTGVTTRDMGRDGFCVRAEANVLRITGELPSGEAFEVSVEFDKRSAGEFGFSLLHLAKVHAPLVTFALPSS